MEAEQSLEPERRTQSAVEDRDFRRAQSGGRARQSPPFERQTRSAKSQSGFTLIETLVALIIFGIISVAISFSLSTALKTQEVNNRRQEELGTVRSIFASLTRDIQAASVSANNLSGIFMSSSAGGSAGKNDPRALLTLSTRSQVLQDSSDASGSSSSGGSFGVQSSQGASVSPQSDLAMVRYEFDPQAHTLKRTTSAVPNVQSLQSDSSSGVIGTGIVSISLRFWDAENSSYRSDWDYEQKNQATPSASSSSSSSGGASGGKTIGLGEGGASSGDPGTSGSGDATLPGSVEVQLELKLKDGSAASYTTNVVILAVSPQSNDAPPLSEERINAAKPAAPSSSGSSTGGQ